MIVVSMLVNKYQDKPQIVFQSAIYNPDSTLYMNLSTLCMIQLFFIFGMRSVIQGEQDSERLFVLLRPRII